MSESGDFDPGPWRSEEHSNFREERRRYDEHAGRSYETAVHSNRTQKDLIPTSLTTQSESPLVIACDVSYSMGDWPATIFSKLPYLDIEGKLYLGQSREISFSAVGDAFVDKYPFQARPFCNGLDLKKRLEELVVEQGGGPEYRESYDLPAVYYSRNVNMPNAKSKPIFIFIADEGLYNIVDKEQARKFARATVNERLTSKEAMEELKQKFNVYLIRKPYNNPDYPGADRIIQAQWESYLGKDHIAELPGADRVLDVIFGILAKERGKVDYFRKEIEERQIDAKNPREGILKVEIAYEALSDIHGERHRVDKKWKKS
jgi:hypothetical protein